MLSPPVVLVTGVPGSGKTTLARRLSPALGLPLLSKDVVEETLFDVLGAGDRAWSTRLGAAANEVLWSLLADCPTGAVVARCDCPGPLAAQRYADRRRHPGHLPADEATLDRIRAAAPGMVGLGVGPALQVDTSRPVDLASVTEWVRRAMGAT